MASLIDRSPWTDVVVSSESRDTKFVADNDDAPNTRKTSTALLQTETSVNQRSVCTSPSTIDENSLSTMKTSWKKSNCKLLSSSPGNDVSVPHIVVRKEVLEKLVECRQTKTHHFQSLMSLDCENLTSSLPSSKSSIGSGVTPPTSISFSIAHILSGSLSQSKRFPVDSVPNELAQSVETASKLSFTHRDVSSDCISADCERNRRRDLGKYYSSPRLSLPLQPLQQCVDDVIHREILACDDDFRDNDFDNDDDDGDGDQQSIDLEEDIMKTDAAESDCDIDIISHHRKVTSLVDKVHQLIDSPKGTSSFEQLSWLQCTRYKPPKLPRSKKLRDGSKKRKLGRNPRVPFTQHQVTVLEHKFHRTHYLSSVDVAELSAALNLTENRVKIWFQNRRARERRNKELISGVNDNTGSHHLQTDAEKTRISSVSSPSTPSHQPLHAIQPTSKSFFFHDPASVAAAVAVAAAAGYPSDAIVRQLNSSNASGQDFFSPSTSLVSWPCQLLSATSCQLPINLRVPGCTPGGGTGGFMAAADLLAHLSSTSSSSLLSSSRLMTNSSVAVDMSGIAASVAFSGRQRLSKYSPLHKFTR